MKTYFTEVDFNTFEKWLICLIFIWLFFALGVQVGIYEGGKLERLKMNIENDRIILSLKFEIEKKEKIISKNKKEIENYKHANKIYQLINCESNFRHTIWGDNGKSYGWFQFQKKTFYYLAKLAKLEELNWKDKYHQLILASWAIENGYGKEWSCFKRGF